MRSPFQQKDLPQGQGKVSSSGCRFAALCAWWLWPVTSCSSSEHDWSHALLSCASSSQLCIPASCRSDLTRCLHRLLVPWQGRLFPSSPNISCLGILPESMLARCPSYQSRFAVSKSVIVSFMPNLAASWLVEILSFHCWYLVTPKIELMHRL